MFRILLESLRFWSSVFLLCTGIGLGACGFVFVYYNKDLPDYTALENYMPSMPTKVYSRNGRLMGEFADQKRMMKTIDEVPQRVIDAFIAAEDKNYYHHPGVDIVSIARAAIQNLINANTNKKSVGGSTITQQVVKNLLLSNERTLSRKVKEAILAYRITSTYSKDKIIEMYLNLIYLGNHSYGIASAAKNYFNKELKELTIAEAAMLAALPKAPSKVNPIRSPERAVARRNWVIERMQEEGYISQDQAYKAMVEKITLQKPKGKEYVAADYFTETVRRILLGNYNYDIVYKEGWTVHTSLEPSLQINADHALRNGLERYDRRHGWRGAIKHIPTVKQWNVELKKIDKPKGSHHWHLAIVLGVEDDKAVVGLKDGSKGYIPLSQLKWARKSLSGGLYFGPNIKSVKQVLSEGDVILVESFGKKANKTFNLRQIPEVNGAIIVMQPKTGRVLAISGGYSAEISSFNRAIQAKRQPGSAFKPFVYLAALESGYSPNDIIMDEPLEIEQGVGLPIWVPKNYGGKFLGAITLRMALEKSRNLATIKLLTVLGFDKVIEVAERLGIYENPPKNYSMALGAFETTLLKMTKAYTSIASNGMKITPSFIDRIHDKDGSLIYSGRAVQCPNCSPEDGYRVLATHVPPEVSYSSEKFIDEVSNYQILSMLEGSVLRGSSRRARQIGKNSSRKNRNDK